LTATSSFPVLPKENIDLLLLLLLFFSIVAAERRRMLMSRTF